MFVKISTPSAQFLDRIPQNMLVGTYVKERDNNRMKGGETGVIFWFKVYCLFMRDMGEAHIFYINGR